MQHKEHLTGLSATQVIQSRDQYGQNILTPPQKEPLWKQFLQKFRDPFIIILLVAGALSVGISFYEYIYLGHGAAVFFEPAGIFIAIFLATGLSFYFELQADKEFTLLNQVNDEEEVDVIRDNNITSIPRKDVVVGDIIVLHTGQEVPADGELLESVHLHIDESTLTGEPLCMKSTEDADFDPHATYPTNFVLKGTKVMEGHGVFKATAIGDKTEQGKVFEAATIDDSVKTPLNEQLERLGKWITKVSYALAFLIIVGRITLYFHREGFSCFQSFETSATFIAYILKTLMIAVTVIVVAVPEGLPMAVTLSLAYSMRRMLKTNNLVRKMHACETMGATSVICTDKTGTLTENKMRVDEILRFDNNIEDKVFFEGLAVNSTAALDFRNSAQQPTVLGNPTEGALLLWLHEKGINYQQVRENTQLLSEIPFTTERKYMATLVISEALNNKKVLYIKGAPEIVYSLCNHQSIDKPTLDQLLLGYQNQAKRTLGFAYQIIEDNQEVIIDNQLLAKNLSFIGIASISDPVRVEVPQAIRRCINAGIQVKIVTGDTIGTAKEIGRQIGLWNDTDGDANITTGPEIEAMSDDELQKRADNFKIIARARPMDKKRLVEALQKNNHVVAVTGDGTNDAPALNTAHVGLSMGDGTSVAKEASDITIIDNSFSSIEKAVMWGRSLYQNIQRFLLFQLTVNVTACLLVFCGAFMGTDSPLTVTQMLWINLIMDTFAAMALASLPPSEKVMKDKPRDRHAFILTREIIYNIIGVGSIFFIMLLSLLYIFQHAEINQLSDLLHLQKLSLSSGEVTPYELSLLFTIFVITHLFYIFNARAFATNQSIINFKGCKGLIFVSIFILLGQIFLVQTPGIQEFFNVRGLKLEDWLTIIIGSSLVIWIREIWYFFRKK